ncbi:glycosyltransferase family 39 protein [Clostridium sp. MSJ-8]|uniref:ArnT family glycosyltransferase n=1 Tax=Clostridium sp. MSJ-8 TaxID=2841510 RepID=UPI001C0F1379|nr:glycosyltransferase family 39 protein [Clostridium sp. MSJ-8]MBU5487377.1 glycosyltransferase family 39 protein [Clostridium sp. MSJ-8]
MKKAKQKQELFCNIILILLFLVLAFITFYNLGEFKVNDWDEARHGVSAYEMLKNKNYIINTYNYENDYWNLKPPISFWMIMLSYKLFGTTIFTMRLYSALSIIILAICVVLFIKKKYDKFTAITWLFLFCCCAPIYYSHMGRNGDADAIALLFLTIAMLSMLKINTNVKNLYLAGFFFALVFLTKSWHSLSIVAIGGLFLIATGLIKKLKLKEWIYFLLSFIVPIGAWGILRYCNDGSKFFVNMVQYDLLKRTSTGIEGNGQNFFYYFKYLITHNLFQATSIVILVIGFILLFKKVKNSKTKTSILNKNDTIGYLLWIFVPLILFSLAKTKLDWYIIPIMIPVLIVASIIFSEIIKNSNQNKILFRVISLVFIALNLLNFIKIVNYINNPLKDSLQDFITNEVSTNTDLKGDNAYIDVDTSNWSQSLLFLGEIEMDFKCNDGGISSYLKDNSKSVLITTKEKYLNNKDLNKEDILVQSSNGNYILLYKK